MKIYIKSTWMDDEYEIPKPKAQFDAHGNLIPLSERKDPLYLIKYADCGRGSCKMVQETRCEAGLVEFLREASGIDYDIEEWGEFRGHDEDGVYVDDTVYDFDTWDRKSLLRYLGDNFQDVSIYPQITIINPNGGTIFDKWSPTYENVY